MKHEQLADSSAPVARPGGRSARIQAAVIDAVEALKQEMPTADITVPMIASRAGITPSTIYRRWGDLAQLLADVAVRRFQADALPPDSGDWQADLGLWLEQFVDEMTSAPGRELLREALAGSSTERAGQCTECILRNLSLILARGRDQGASPPSAETLLDQVVAPVIYRILFTKTVPSTDYAAGLLRASLATANA
ncbi:TetR/AcrR family transcriptional regulator [Brucella pseudogrignonensis]|uniref:TetR/AcrR family transcriptional regulator n=1 Tax=Brucella pseudogrignonensis TaxID=419475 RepID=UPI001EDA87CC|nr:TetR/AcrR family transcriptional regulator [Brucella pseudogrignonensis]UKK94710.1 TetR/AcrR family transcriptional regulator [Brucella pseudogrignonensis]